MGCHFDGLDVETWARGQLVDIFVPGCRSLEVDVYAFRRITAGTPIRLYPALDDHHAASGYCYPPIEVFRGAFSNWYRQGADGVQAFNFAYAPDSPGPAELHRQAYQEMGDPEKMKYMNKTFVLSRRGGGHGPRVVPDAHDWRTPRHMYANTNMFSPLPAALDNDGKADTLLTLFVGDDFNSAAERITDIALRVLLHDADAGGYVHVTHPARPEPAGPQRIGRAVIDSFRGIELLYNGPPARGIEDRTEVRINNIPLGRPIVESGWIVFKDLQPWQFAVGENLIGVRLTERAPEAVAPVLIEKLELDVSYR